MKVSHVIRCDGLKGKQDSSYTSTFHAHGFNWSLTYHPKSWEITWIRIILDDNCPTCGFDKGGKKHGKDGVCSHHKISTLPKNVKLIFPKQKETEAASFSASGWEYVDSKPVCYISILDNKQQFLHCDENGDLIVTVELEAPEYVSTNKRQKTSG